MQYQIKNKNINKEEKWLFFGLLSRLIELRVNQGKYEKCEDLIHLMLDGLNLHYNLDVYSDVDQHQNFLTKHEDLANKGFNEFVISYPCFLGRFLYHYGMWLLNHKGSYIKAYVIFTFAANIIEKEIKSLYFRIGNEELFDLAKRHTRISISYELNRIGYVHEELDTLKEELNNTKKELVRIRLELNKIYNSRGWKTLGLYYKFKEIINKLAGFQR